MIKISNNIIKFSAIKTCLNALHLQQYGKIVEFAGYQLPVQYKAGIMKEHLHCRTSSALFDVSHMGQLTITGNDALNILQRTTVGSTNRRSKGPISQCYLTMFLNQKGGIIDDAIATVLSNHSVRIVVNGANKHKVVKHLNDVSTKQNFNVDIKLHDDKGLIALQGPKSVEVLSKLFQSVKFADIPFMSQFIAHWNNNQYLISRSGYTGEDGFEISSQGGSVLKIASKLLENKLVMMAGLGARDSLRLEAGLCLHGNDITEDTTPFEAGLMWTVHKRVANDTRLKFIGEDSLNDLVFKVKQKKTAIKKRVGYTVDNGIVRDHCKVFAGTHYVGITTSGTYSPSLKYCVGFAYVNQQFAKQGVKLQADLRSKRFPLVIKKLPFVPTNYYKGWSSF